jgi:hypothetical protein
MDSIILVNGKGAGGNEKTIAIVSWFFAGYNLADTIISITPTHIIIYASDRKGTSISIQSTSWPTSRAAQRLPVSSCLSSSKLKTSRSPSAKCGPICMAAFQTPEWECLLETPRQARLPKSS